MTYSLLRLISILACLFIFFSCTHQTQEERRIRKSINKYLNKIKLHKHTRKNYSLVFKEYNEADFILQLKNENNANREASIASHAATVVEHRRKFESGRQLTLQEMEFDSTKPNTIVFKRIDDSLSGIKPDISKRYYYATAFQLYDKDTVWKKTFWLNSHYKIVW